MSRIGKLEIKIPDGVTVEIAGNLVTAKGKEGASAVVLPKMIEIRQEASGLVLTNPGGAETSKYYGLARTLTANLIQGVADGFTKQLELVGVGYRANVQGQKLVLALGFSHPVEVEAPEGVSFVVEKNTITVSGIDKQAVGEVAAKIRAFKKPEPYKGKGIKYIGETIRRKAGKSAAKAGKAE